MYPKFQISSQRLFTTLGNMFIHPSHLLYLATGARFLFSSPRLFDAVTISL